jgi:2-polyprenyl-3-methyl-5-hydroxy-6-metoxy-1,4-benzoquinol methylase
MKIKRKKIYDKDILRNIYDTIYRDNGHKIGLYGSEEQRDPHIIKYLQDHARPPATVLEASCGRGHLARSLIKLGYLVTGTENSPWLVENQLKDIGAVLASYQELPTKFHSKSFDVVISSDVLEHLPTEEEVIEAISILAKLSKQYLLISVGLKFGANRYPDALRLPLSDLHMVCPGRMWWKDTISKYVNVDYTTHSPRTGFFFGRVRG